MSRGQGVEGSRGQGVKGMAESCRYHDAVNRVQKHLIKTLSYNIDLCVGFNDMCIIR